MSKVFLKKGKDESVKRFHPWIFSGAIFKMEGNPEEGDLVEIYNSDGDYVGCGHYQNATIVVRVLSFDRSALKSDFWFKSLEAAFTKREHLGLTSGDRTNCYRLVHGEGDNLPGLIIDYYNGRAVIQCHSTGMYRNRADICQSLKKLYGDSLISVYDKSAQTIPGRDRDSHSDGYLFGTPGDGEVSENGISFIVNWEVGQKTGFFLDQRENREMVKRFSKGKRVLNLFCYTGGFSLYALSGGASLVHSVDSSKKALEMLDSNLKLNVESNLISADSIHKSYCTDAIEFLRSVEQNSYDLMIVDPPAFAKHRDALRTALRAYQRLNAQAISKISSGGIIFTYSCSQAVDKISFAQAIFSAAAQTGRKVSVIGRLTQPADHPVNIYHPEGEYLKGLILYVE